MKKYYEELSILRGVAILLVLLGHSIILFPINLKNVTWCSYLYQYIYFFHMPLFFIIAGFCYSKKNNYKDYFISKFKRILIPYLVFSILDLVPRHLLPQLINGNKSIYDDIKSIIFNGGQYWFLYVLFILFILFPIIEKVLDNKIYSSFIILFLIIISSFDVSKLFSLNQVFNYLFYFIIGNLFKRIYADKYKNIMSKWNISLLTIITFIAIGLLPKNHVTDIIKAISGSVMAYSIVVFIKNKTINSTLRNFGDFSLQLYLLNGFMLVPARVIVVNLLHIKNPLFIIALIFISNALVGILLSKYIINKFTITKYLCGITIKNTQKSSLTPQSI